MTTTTMMMKRTFRTTNDWTESEEETLWNHLSDLALSKKKDRKNVVTKILNDPLLKPKNWKHFSLTIMARGVCGACGTIREKSSFGYSQWHKKYDAARCKPCIARQQYIQPKFSHIAQTNVYNSGDFTHKALDDPIIRVNIEIEGGSNNNNNHDFNYYCHYAKGDYVSGKCEGEDNLCRWLFQSGKEQPQNERDTTLYDRYIYRMFHAYDLIEMWNRSDIIEEYVHLNIPGVFMFREGDRDEGKVVLQEPWLNNYQKFNSNTGWTPEGRDDDSWTLAMQALCHFTYHATDGEYLMCHLTGSIQQKNRITLVDPVIHSRDRQYGSTDLGMQGISHFFGIHQCNEYCDPDWLKPDDQNLYFKENIQEQTFRRAVTADNQALKDDETDIGKILELDEDKWILQNIL